MSKTIDLLHELGYQLTAGECTNGECMTDRCNNGARGGLYCHVCATTRLAEVTTPEFASRAATLMRARRGIQSSIDHLYTYLEGLE